MYWNRYGKKYQVIDSNLAHTDKELERLKNMKKFKSTGDWVRPIRVSNTNTLFDDLYEVHYNICGHKKSEVMQYTLHARFGKLWEMMRGKTTMIPSLIFVNQHQQSLS